MEVKYEIPSADILRLEGTNTHRYIETIEYFVTEIRKRLQECKSSADREAPLGGIGHGQIPLAVREIFEKAGYSFGHLRDDRGYATTCQTIKW